MPAVPSIDTKPLYAIAGAGDAAVTALRARVVALPESVKTLQSTVQTQLQSQVKALPARVQVVPGQVKDLRAQLRKQVHDLATRAEQAYGEFAAQGAKAVAARRGTTQVTTKSASKPAAKRASKPAATSPEPAVAAGAVAGPTGTTESNLNGSGQTA